MANDLNRVLLIGRLTRDPELKSTSSGAYFCKFSIASNRSYYKKETGETRDEVGFFDCIAWNKLAEILGKYLQKGKRVAIDGNLRWSQWENQEGKKQSKVEIYVDTFQFLDNKSDTINSNAVPSSGQNATNYDSPPAQPSTNQDNFISDDDMPF